MQTIFTLEKIPKSVQEKAKFGLQKLTLLLNHFGEKRGSGTTPINIYDTKREWSLLKNLMFAKCGRLLLLENRVTSSTLAEEMISYGL